MAFSDGTVITKKGSKMLCVPPRKRLVPCRPVQKKRASLFSATFTPKSTVKSAKIYASALGVFDLFINGKRVGQDGTTMYDELKPKFGPTTGRNQLHDLRCDPSYTRGRKHSRRTSGNGWWGGAIAHACTVSPSLGFIAKLRLEYEDGTIENIVTGTDWALFLLRPRHFRRHLQRRDV